MHIAQILGLFGAFLGRFSGHIVELKGARRLFDTVRSSRTCHIQHSPGTPTKGLCERGNDSSKSTGCSGRQKATTRRNMRREEWVIG